MRERLMRFMQGRYGVDTLGKFLTGAIFALLILSMFIRKSGIHAFLNILTLVLLVVLYARTFSRNYSKRYAENQKFLEVTAPVRNYMAKQKNRAKLRKNYRLFKCPGCKQVVKVPKGKGKISIRCPKCQKEFIRRS